MLFISRHFEIGAARGLQFFLQKDWTTPVEQHAMACFAAFDEILYRLGTDKESTRPYIRLTGSAALSDLMTATETALRRTPRWLQPGSSLWTTAVLRREPKTLWFLPPPFARACVESADGSFRSVFSKNETEWSRLELEPGDRFLHLRLFSDWEDGPKGHVLAGGRPNPSYFRLSELIARSKDSSLSPVFSLDLAGKTT
jgi:hypothetical protein